MYINIPGKYAFIIGLIMNVYVFIAKDFAITPKKNTIFPYNF